MPLLTFPAAGDIWDLSVRDSRFPLKRGIMTKLRTIPALLSIALLGAMAGSCSDDLGPSPSGNARAAPDIEKQVIVSGIASPWDIAFLPDGNMLFTERAGRIGIFFPDSGTHRTLLEPKTGFYYDRFQAGMMGIAVDPDFAANRYIYTFMTSTAVSPSNQARRVDDVTFEKGNPIVTAKRGGFAKSDKGKLARSPAGPAMAEGTNIARVIDSSTIELRRLPLASASSTTLTIEPLDNRVVRWVVDEEYASLQRDADIVTGIPYGAHRYYGHNGGRIRFGPGGYLWIATGDGDFGHYAQNGKSLGGKILRVDRNGAPAPGNGAPDGFDARIYSYGHRNPQGIAFQPKMARVYAIGHGPGTDDEVNLLVPGGNYGWVNGAKAMTDRKKFPAAKFPVWKSGNPTLAPSGASFISNGAGTDWKGWNGALAVGMLKTQQLLVMHIDAFGHVLETESILANPNWRIRSVVQGPDGSLYLAVESPKRNSDDRSYYTNAMERRKKGEIWRISPKPN